jgi:galactokinase
MKEQIAQIFREIFGNEPVLAFAPGRINLIGEHTDYQEGLVFPAAVEKGIYIAIQKNNTSMCKLYSFDFDQEYSFSLHEISPKKGHWANYVMGMVSQFAQAGFNAEGFDMVIAGDIPVGSGLSSSAAFSIAIGTGVAHLFNFSVPTKSLVLYAQKSEHLFAGVMCGIMDPYASAFGAKDKALLLDCRTNTHQEVIANLGEYSLLLVNTNVKHSLADSAYNKRRAACEESVKLLKIHYPQATTLRDIAISEIKEVEKLLPADLFPKAKHVITEIERVRMTSQALRKNDLPKFGELLKASHLSLSKDFEVSCKELDFLSEKSWEFEDVLGSRMMGGGFGGCTINLIKTEVIPQFQREIAEKYTHEFDINPDFILVKLSEGARILD